MVFSEFVHFITDGFRYIYGEDIRIRQETIFRNNGDQYTGLCIYRPGIDLSPVINLTTVWDEYLSGTSREDLLLALILSYQNQSLHLQDFPSAPATLEEAAPHLVLKLIHQDRNRDFLQKVPHRGFLDLAIVYGLFYEMSEDSMALAILQWEQLRHWKVTEEQLYECVLTHMPSQLPAKLASMEQWLTDFAPDAIAPTDSTINLSANLPDVFSGEIPLFILTNEKHYLGASSILYPHILEDYHRFIQEDFWLIPSSIHEMILVPQSMGLSAWEAEQLLRDVNMTTTADADQLSDHIYSYTPENGLQICHGE